MTETPTTGNAAPMSATEMSAIDASVVSREGRNGTTGWQVMVASGTLSIVIGAAMLIWPEATLRVVAVLVGIWVLLSGIARILDAFLPGRSLGRHLLSGIVGVLLVIAGVACLRELVNALALLAFVIALTWIFSGLAGIVLALQTTGTARAWLLAIGILSVGIGVVFLVVPELSLTALLYLTAVSAIVVGIGELGVAFQLRKVSIDRTG
jgi:uncharacterized membrane protein HdeD (DUF308 family)